MQSVSPMIQQTKPFLLGVHVASLTVSELHGKIAEYVLEGTHALVLHANVFGLNLAYEQRWLRDFLNMAHIVFCDGAGVKFGAQILGYHIPQRITYADWMWQLSEFCERREFTLFFLGGRPGVAEKAAQNLSQYYPNIRIVGMHHGYFDKTSTGSENDSVIQQINFLQPNILLVGFGMPMQERWLMENWNNLKVDVALTGGAVFDYVSGELRRGPKWMTDNGFEWLARLVIEPKRLWKRYILGNPLFLYRIFKQRLGLSNLDGNIKSNTD